MWRALRRVFLDVQENAGVHCVVVSGRHGHFCAGGDIAEYPDFRFDSQDLRDFHESDVWGGLQAMLDCDVPIVAQIEGNCMGAGLEIASCCDLRFAGDSARFGAPIARLGFPMAPREAALVLRAVGDLTAREMLLSAAVLDAIEMKRRGFLNQVVGARELGATVQVCVERMIALAPQAARMNKRVLRALAPESIDIGAPELIANCYHYADSVEHREGIAAFIEKRPARFMR
jgi:enoyl-CoA hydratase/carnithine racemase